ncbi:MAG: copper homeostasis protein CutC [Bacteroidota bacterium]
MILEVCASNFEIAKEAAQAGADRLEICQNLSQGGLTPSYGFIEKACQLDLPIRVLIRPRAGDFDYSVDELETMLNDIRICEDLGAEAVVIGAVSQENRLDKRANQVILESSERLKFIFHRGIDIAGTEGVAEAYALGFDGALCSGHLRGLQAGVQNLQRYLECGSKDFELVAGGGLKPEMVRVIQNIGLSSFHFSCQKILGEERDDYNHRIVFDQMKWEQFDRLRK